jgi:hypothetical protein
MVKALLRCGIIEKTAELTSLLDLTSYLHRARAFAAPDVHELTYRLVPQLLLSLKFVTERLGWCATVDKGSIPAQTLLNDVTGRVFDFRPRETEKTMAAAIRRSKSERKPNEVRTLLDAVKQTGGRAAGTWGILREIYKPQTHEFLRPPRLDAYWLNVARCVVAQFAFERCIAPAYAAQAWNNARAVWSGTPEQDAEADVASVIELLDMEPLLDQEVYTTLSAQLVALRALKVHHFDKPPTLFTHLLGVLLPPRAWLPTTYARTALIAHTAAVDVAQSNAAFGADPEAQLATARQIAHYANRLDEMDEREAYGQLREALEQRTRYAPAPPQLVLTVLVRVTGAMCGKSGWASSQKNAGRR